MTSPTNISEVLDRVAGWGRGDATGVHVRTDLKPAEAEAHLKRIIELKELKASIKALEWVLKVDGRWDDDTEVGIVQLSSNPLDRAIADRLFELQAQRQQLEEKL